MVTITCDLTGAQNITVTALKSFGKVSVTQIITIVISKKLYLPLAIIPQHSPMLSLVHQ